MELPDTGHYPLGVADSGKIALSKTSCSSACSNDPAYAQNLEHVEMLSYCATEGEARRARPLGASEQSPLGYKVGRSVSFRADDLLPRRLRKFIAALLHFLPSAGLSARSRSIIAMICCRAVTGVRSPMGTGPIAVEECC